MNLINRYVKNPHHPEWSEKWAQVYDQNGEERYGFVLIHVSSDLLSPDDHEAFATGFDAVADEVFRLTEKKVGFFIDVLPATSAWGRFKASPGADRPSTEEDPIAVGHRVLHP